MRAAICVVLTARSTSDCSKMLHVLKFASSNKELSESTTCKVVEAIKACLACRVFTLHFSQSLISVQIFCYLLFPPPHPPPPTTSSIVRQAALLVVMLPAICCRCCMWLLLVLWLQEDELFSCSSCLELTKHCCLKL